MLRFFRNFRQKLLSENPAAKTSSGTTLRKYLIYAIGEIALVVVGILIALQINNHNQSIRDKKFETTMLKEIKSSLESDQYAIKMFNRFTENKENSIQELLEMTTSNKVYQDSVLLKLYNGMNFSLTFYFNRGAYEAIKSVGIDRISNDSLRQKIIETYEVLLPRVEQIISFRSEELANNDYKLSLHNALWKRVRIEMPDNSYKLVSQTIDRENFLKKTEFLDRIKIEQDIVNLYNFWLADAERSVEKCLNAVNKELESD